MVLPVGQNEISGHEDELHMPSSSQIAGEIIEDEEQKVPAGQSVRFPSSALECLERSSKLCTKLVKKVPFSLMLLPSSRCHLNLE